MLVGSVLEVGDVIPYSEAMLLAMLVDEVRGFTRSPDEAATFVHAPLSYRENWWCAVEHKR
jgi:hypothetical protein